MKITRNQTTRAMREFATNQQNLYGDADSRERAEIDRKARAIRAENMRRTQVAA